jgi:hypothetical protein
MQVEGDVGQFGRGGEVLDEQARAARGLGVRSLTARLPRSIFAPSIISTRRSSTPGSIFSVADAAPVAQHRGAVAKLRDLGEAVGDVDHAAPVLGLRTRDAQHALHEVGGQSGGHFVEQQHVGRAGQRAGEVNDPQRGQRQVADHRVEAQFGVAQLGHPVAESHRRRVAEAQVVGDVQIGDERWFLVDRHEARAPRLRRRADARWGAPGSCPARIGLQIAPVRILTKVDLPAPFAPIRATTSPRRTVRLASVSARTAPKLLATLRASRSVSASAGREWVWDVMRVAARRYLLLEDAAPARPQGRRRPREIGRISLRPGLRRR